MTKRRATVPTFRTKAWTAAEALRKAIHGGDIAPGERIDIAAFARSIDVSMTPLREALRQLEAEGLVINTPHRGVRVTEFSLRETGALYDLRQQLEGYALRRSIPRLSQDDIEQLEVLTDLHRLAVERDDRRAYDQYNREWHELAYSRAETPYLAEFIARLWNAFPWMIMWQGPERLASSVAGHAQILAALKGGQVDIAEALLRDHILDGKEYVIRQLEKLPHQVEGLN